MIKERDIYIDVAKGITILLVIYGHLQNPINEIIYSFHMPAFFFMSGMFVKKMSMKDTILEKSRRLLIPFIIYYLYMVLMKMGRLVLSGKCSIEFFHPLNKDAVYYSIGPIWFLLALFYIFIIHSLVSRCKISIQWLAVISLSIIPFMCLGSNPLYINSALLGCLFFFAGKVYFSLQGGGKNSKRSNLVNYCCFSSIVFVLFFSK